MPVMGRHSVILRPDSVRRVTPPTTMTAKTRVEENISQLPTERGGRTLGFEEKARMRGNLKGAGLAGSWF